jgi:hypothetical protein
MIHKLALLVAVTTMFGSMFSFKLEQPFEAVSLEDRAELAGMTTEEFVLISSVVEAESDRTTQSTEGRRYIALCILCRVMDTRFPDNITGVLTQRGQFSTVRNGHSVTNRTDLSDQAVIEAVEWIESGEEYPWVLFFNCRNFFSGYEAYECIGGNYFSVAEPSLPDNTHG